MLRTRTGATVVAVVRNGRRETNPGPDFILSAEDVLLLLGSPEQIAQAVEQFGAGNSESSSDI